VSGYKIQNKVKIALLGGSFNPIHLGHLNLADIVRCQLNLDRLYFVPAFISPFKPEITQVTPTQRLEMIELAIEENEHFSLLPWELEHKGPSYTIDTVFRSIQTFGLETKELGIIIGMDNLKDLQEWHRFSELCPLVTWIIAQRPNTGPLSIPQSWVNRWSFTWIEVENPKLEISSSSIRKQIHNGQPFRYLIPEKVYQYIVSGQLYGI
jgi:nicotinate-nucleotide adenylyltransferase